MDVPLDYAKILNNNIIMRKILHILVIIIFSVISENVYSNIVVIDGQDYNCVEQHGNGGHIADVTPGNGTTRVLMAYPESGYKFAEWVGSMGTRYAVNPIIINFGANRSNVSLSAYFVNSDMFIDMWDSDTVFIRSKSTDISDGSEFAFFRAYINGERVVCDNNLIETIDYGYWKMTAKKLLTENIHTGEKLHVVFYDDCSQISGVIDTIIPAIIQGNCNSNDITYPFNSDVHILNDAVLTISDNTYIHGVLNIHAGGKVIVPYGVTLTVDGLIMNGDGIDRKWAQLIVDGSLINNNSNILNYDYKLDWNLWYPLSVPYDVACADIHSRIHGNTAYFTIMEYNTIKRAQGKSGFEVFNDTIEGAILESGKGYVVWGEPTQWNGQWQIAQPTVIRFPMIADLTQGEGTKIVKTVYTENAKPINKNWNLIGNPCLAEYTPSHKGDGIANYVIELNDGEYAHDIADINYLVYSEDGFRSYEQDIMTYKTMQPFNSYFTQTEFNTPLAFVKNDRARQKPRRVAEDSTSIDNKEYRIGVLMRQEDRVDRIGLLYSDYYSDEYEINFDLLKMFGEKQSACIYSLMGFDNEPLAYQAIHKNKLNESIPIGYRNLKTTSTAISFDDARYSREKLNAVWLHDIVTGDVVNLLEEDYEFTPQTSHEDGRLYINVEVHNEQIITTEINNVNNSNNVVMMFDMLGNRVNNKQKHGVYVVVDNQNNAIKIVK